MDTVAVVQHKLVKTVKWVYFYWEITGTISLLNLISLKEKLLSKIWKINIVFFFCTIINDWNIQHKSYENGFGKKFNECCWFFFYLFISIIVIYRL